jgi:hypothetical protein
VGWSWIALCGRICLRTYGRGVSTGAVDPALLRFTMESNQMFCTDGAVVLQASGKIALASEVRFANNFVQSCSGFTLLAQGLDLTVAGNTFSLMAAIAGEGNAYGGAIVASLSQMRIANNDVSRNASVLTISNTAGSPAVGVTQGGSSYTWVVTAVLPGDREALLTLPAVLTTTGAVNATLQWPVLPGAKSYNVYRTTANTAALLLVGPVNQSTGTTITFLDAVADGSLKVPLPAMQNDGIVIGYPTDVAEVQSSFAATIVGLSGTQVTANRINGLTGMGILCGSLLLETLIDRNQLLLLGGNGIVLGACTDLDILGNSLNFTGLLAKQGFVSGVQISSATNANISDNRIQQVGPTIVQSGLQYVGILIRTGSGVRFSGNRIADVGPSTAKSAGIVVAQASGTLDVSGNEIRRASTPPATVDQSIWLALWLSADSPIIQGNVLESFGGPGNNNKAGINVSGVIDIAATGSCIFSNNQCFLDDPKGNPQIIVVKLTAASIIAMGNRVTGPIPLAATAFAQSMLLNITGPQPLAATVIGNITSSKITVTPVDMPAAMAPLNVIA